MDKATTPKLMTLVKAPAALAPEDFAAGWRDRLLPDLAALPGIGAHLVRAVHHHVVPSDIRAEEGIAVGHWAGVATYYFDDGALIDALPADPAFAALFARHAGLVEEAVHLPVDELWMYDRDPGILPLKMFAFFKRRPDWSRDAAQAYYRTTHAEVGESINRGRTVRYIQNHVRGDFRAADPSFDFDAGPESWFKSMDVALDLFGDHAAMATLGADEEKFVLRGELLNFLTDEQVVYVREPALT